MYTTRMIIGWVMIVFGAVAVGLGMASIITRQPAPLPTIPPCAAEDGGPYPCVWDGPSRGTPGAQGYRQGDRVTITEPH